MEDTKIIRLYGPYSKYITAAGFKRWCVASGADFFLLSFGLFLSCFVKVELGCCPVWSLWFTGHVGIGYQLDSSVQAKCSMMCFFVVC